MKLGCRQTRVLLKDYKLILYYITDRHQFAGTEQQKCRQLLSKIADAARTGIDFIQLREKDLPPRDLLALARSAISSIHAAASNGMPSRLLINSRIDVALASGADGVHLTSEDIPASDARAIWASSRATTNCLVAVSCHAVKEVRLAEAHGADFAVFAPVFEKKVTRRDENAVESVSLHRTRNGGEGLADLRMACRAEGRPTGPEGIGTTRMPVLALGGITLQNAAACLAAGAAGIAAIRLFQENDVASVVRQLKTCRASAKAEA